MKTFFPLLVILAVLFSSTAGAVGISGSDLNRKEMFVPDSVYEFSYNLVAGYVENDYNVYATQDLAQYVVFEKTRFEDVPAGSIIPFSGRVKFPSSLEPPGWHIVYICVGEECAGEGTMCGRAAACAGLNFMVLYPGINPVVSIFAPNVNRDKIMNFTVSVNNLGKDDISSCSGTIGIFNLEGTKVGAAQLESRPVKSTETVPLIAPFDTVGILPGNHTVVADIVCDGTMKQANTSFRIGNLDVKIVDYTKELTAGSIKRFVTKVESIWNDPLDVYAEITVYDGINPPLKVKTANMRLAPWQMTDLEAFIDTSSLEAKDYKVKIEAFFAEKSVVLDGTVKILPMPAAAVNATAAVEESPEKQGMSMTKLTVLLVIVVIILTMINIFFVFYRKKK